jgi:hypothetical protein
MTGQFHARVRQIVDSGANKAQLHERLSAYPLMAKLVQPFFRSPRPPYCTHPFEWRLATWSRHAEGVFKRFETLLERGERVAGWEGEKGLFRDIKYGAFWSILWQLQVVDFLLDRGLAPKWQNPGPDLLISVNHLGKAHEVEIECFATRQEYEPILFLEELLEHLDGRLVVRYAPGPNSASALSVTSLENLFESCLNCVDAELAKDSDSERVVYSSPQGGALEVRLVPDETARPWADQFDAATAYSTVIDKVFTAKAGKNGLGSSSGRRNAVFANTIVSPYYQSAVSFLEAVAHFPLSPELPTMIDTIAVSVTGIDETLDASKLRWFPRHDSDHPLRTVLGG